MKTSLEIIEEQRKIINEVESFFKIQSAYFDERTSANLDKVKIQTSKIKQMIKDTKPVTPSLR